MVVPLYQYVALKDKYFIGYFGQDKKVIELLLQARNLIEKELAGLKVFLVCSDNMRRLLNGHRNIVHEINLGNYRKKIAAFTTVDNEQDIKKLLEDSGIVYNF